MIQLSIKSGRIENKEESKPCETFLAKKAPKCFRDGLKTKQCIQPF